MGGTRNRLRSDFQRCAGSRGRPVLGVWAGTPERLTPVLAGETFLEAMCRRASRDTGIQLALTDEGDKPFLCKFAGEVRSQAARTAAATSLPWTLHVASAEKPRSGGRKAPVLDSSVSRWSMAGLLSRDSRHSTTTTDIGSAFPDHRGGT